MDDGETTPRSGDEVIAELVQLSARIDAAVQRQLTLIREVHERELWFVWGLRRCTEWLTWRLGLSPGASRERLRVALALGKLPKIDAAFAKGQVSYSKVRAMTRVATPKNEADLLSCARNATAAQLERICRGIRQVAKNEANGAVMDGPLELPEREVSVRMNVDGSARMTVVMHQDEAAQLLGVIDRVRAALRNEGGDVAKPTRADALVRMAMLANDALDSGTGARDSENRAPCSDSETRRPIVENREPNADSGAREPIAGSAHRNRRPNPSSELDDLGAAALCRRGEGGRSFVLSFSAVNEARPREQKNERTSPLSVDGAAASSHRQQTTTRARTGADHALVALHFQPEMLGDGFTALLDDGSRVPAETFRRVACDCALTATLNDDQGEPLDAGRKTRSISPALRRALDRRDGGCRFPGCRCTRFVHAHHVEHWAHGGETSLGNLVTLCPFHHRLVHEGGFTVAMNEGTPLFRNPSGVPIPDVPAETPPSGPLHESTGPLRTDVDIDANLFWLQRRPDYKLIVGTMVQ